MRLINCVLIGLLMLANPSHACNPVPIEPQADAGRAEYVLLVRVTAVELGRISTLESVLIARDEPASIASYEVESRFKGEVPVDRRFAVALPPPRREARDLPEIVCAGDPPPHVGERWLLYRFAAHHFTRAYRLPGLVGDSHLAWWQRHTVKP